MDQTLRILLALILFFGAVHAQILAPILKPKPSGGGGASVNCGYSPTTPASSDNNSQLPQATPCTTGANANGYSVSSVSWYSAATSTTDSYDLGIYSNTSTAPVTLICHTAGFTPTVAVGYNSHAISGCGTLTANTTYWVAYISHDGTLYGHDSGNCPGFAVSTVFGTGQSATPATLPGSFGTASSLGECQAMYITLSPL